MNLCTHCRKRKPKRRCPVLGGGLCQLCCGLLRDNKFHCPESCPYLARHKSYQEERILQKKQAFSGDILDDERMNWLSLHIEAPLEEAGERRRSFTDRDAVLALEYARDKAEKGARRILLPGRPDTPKNEVGEMVFQSMENCRYQRSIVLPGSLETYAGEEKRKCLENVILTVKYMARGRLEGRSYIDHLIGRFAHIQEASKQKKVISTV
jgi:hypothetical protein